MKELTVIQNEEPQKQLELFLSAINQKKVPVILPKSFDSSSLNMLKIPEEADFAVSSSGTTGKPKLYFRTLKSWAAFIPEQNKAFNVKNTSRIFINGSLAFTGNLNIAVTARLNGNFLYVSKELKPQNWAKEILINEIDTIYMIPDKLFHLAKTGTVFTKIKTIILGSQSVSKNQFRIIKASFPEAEIFLYYGSSETSYISYKKLTEQNTEDSECTGTIFDSVKVKISEQGHILAESPWSVIGVTGFFDTGDTGSIKNGSLYLTGRADDVINIHGQKINKARIIKCLLEVPGIEEAFVTTEEINSVLSVVAYIAGPSLPQKIDITIFNSIESVFIPKKYIRLKELPKNESGKISFPAKNSV